MALRRAQVAAALGVEAGGARLHALVHAVVRAAADLLLRRADRAPLLEARAVLGALGDAADVGGRRVHLCAVASDCRFGTFHPRGATLNIQVKLLLMHLGLMPPSRKLP